MLDRAVEWLLDTLNRVPILFGTDPHNAELVRAVAAILLIVLIVYIIAMRPFRSIFAYFSNRTKQIKHEEDRENHNT